MVSPSRRRPGIRPPYKAPVGAILSGTKKPLILLAGAADLVKAGLEAAAGTRPLVHAADSGNWQAMAEVVKAAKAPLAVRADTLDGLAELTQTLTQAGLEDLVLDPGVDTLYKSLFALTSLRR